MWLPRGFQIVIYGQESGGLLRLAVGWKKSTLGSSVLRKRRIICLTKENLDSPWLLFEAGALSKALDNSYVCPYLLEIDESEIVGPLSQFQAKRTKKSSTLELVQSINEGTHNPLEEARLLQRFEALWPQLERALGEIPQDKAEGLEQRRTTEEILEELVKTVRATDRRILDLDMKLNFLELIAPETRQEPKPTSTSGWGQVIQQLKRDRQALTAAVYGEAKAM